MVRVWVLRNSVGKQCMSPVRWLSDRWLEVGHTSLRGLTFITFNVSKRVVLCLRISLFLLSFDFLLYFLSLFYHPFYFVQRTGQYNRYSGRRTFGGFVGL